MDAICPLDGRYAAALAPLAACFSERALVQARIDVELRYLEALTARGLFPDLSVEERARVAVARGPLSDDDFAVVKAIEARTRHDVKAVEIFLRERLALRHPGALHFGLTSEDLNNLAWSSLFLRFRDGHQRPLLGRLILALAGLAERWAFVPFPAHTHGQPASPTTAGKELAVFAWRLLRLWRALGAHRFRGKLAGATGNYAAMLAAFPDHDWPGLARELVTALGLDHAPVVTQIEDHDAWAAWFDLSRAVNNVVLDLDRDLWEYISRDLFRQRAAPGQVGSSTMPHKINPIRFENSEGNLELANAQLGLLSDKLCRSRMQRDLSDSTVQRNVGVAMAHSWLAWSETLGGLARVELDEARCRAALEAHPELLAEPIQTVLRAEGVEDPYEILRQATQGRRVERADLLALIEAQPISEGARARLRGLQITDLCGLAATLALDVVRAVRAEVQP
ncbi:MAG: adenylosuccinate lyase [Pseudomonadota bacterium]